MKAMVLREFCSLETNQNPLLLMDLPIPVPEQKELLLQISACGVCHTELDEIEGRAIPYHLPVIPGHQVVGTVCAAGANVVNFKLGDRVGVAWIYQACGKCSYCLAGKENLCPEFKATGCDANGGYAQYMTITEDFAYKIPDFFSDTQAAPLLCAGAIGYRSLRLTGLQDGQNLGLTGFGASAHLVLKMVRYRYPNSSIYVFARNVEERNFAKQLGAVWAGNTSDSPPQQLHSIIDTTPAWRPVVAAMKNLLPGGRLVINAIRKEGDKESLLQLDYASHLWLEKEIKSVANITRCDVRDFLSLAAEMQLVAEVEEFPLEMANKALLELKNKQIRGAKVLKIHSA
jgi:alcohol dehydrogenase, propanol-preferring